MINRIEGLIIHWSASNSKTLVEDIRGWHTAQGWRDIGYHRVILHPDSIKEISILEWSHLVKQGRELDDDLYLEIGEQGAHAKGFNKNHVGICVVGSPKYQMHPLQKAALRNTCRALLNRFKLPLSSVKLHREVNPTECPGEEISELIKKFRTEKMA
jgi:hypothetical protein